ncbi:hypothetical protein [Clostridium neonatale]|uniref:Autolysin n=5 Tax=Clostridium TaxID=1485 RepID=A0A653AP08_9CLOT|nr:hypothetical protein [Clostridium neonatale]CAG9710264.1 Conserved hypothetical protein, Cell wall binding repeats [Clostridium neonatale]CAI3207573.1 Conserved hypothetical protein, Cell wall binding repeats [Clostridium neonatale]CAI3213296.1 Conserved hypothetical protein, Cell wall binding repeats [Clostridium neonatale]CAI3538407.1 Conserved hypothetical protein, Cell wall binding repeats [Clostridium neonatale]CAI3564973.1 Conserved hypothetical protein, Cell wall binding repeats [Clo
MIKRTNKILALIISATTATTLCPSVKVFAAETLKSKEGSFSNAVAYSNKYLYDGNRESEEEKTVLYSNGKYKELEDTDAYDIEKYDNKYIELDDDNGKNLFNLQTGKFEDESIEDQEFDIKRKLIKELKDTDRYGEDVGKYLNLDKRISTNKESFGDVWYQYSVDYNGVDDENTRYITTIDINANSKDEWDNITLKKGSNVESTLFGDQYQFWFSVTANEADNKELDGQGKTFNGDVEAASEYIAGRLREYCGCDDVKVITVDGKVVIQIISTTQLDEDVIVSHNNDISITTKKTTVDNIPENPEVPDIPSEPDVPVDPEVPDTPNESITRYITTIDINANSKDEWDNITLKKGSNVEATLFGDQYQFWFSVTANEADNKELDGQGKTFNGDVEAASEYIAGRLREYCGCDDVKVITVDGKVVIQIISTTQLDEDVIVSHNNDISITTKKTTVDNIPENPEVLDTQNSSVFTSPEAVEINNDFVDARLYGNSSRLSIESDLPVYYGIVNNLGKYMDISSYANIKFIYKVDGKTKTANIEKFGEKYGEENITATLKSLDILAQDSTYVYARVNVEFSADRDIDVVYADGENSKEYILKISKSLGKKVDEAYVPKQVDAYEMNGESDFKSWIQPKINDDWYNLDIFAKNENLYIIRFNKDGENKKNEIQCIQVNFQTNRDNVLGVSRNKISKVCDPSVSTRLKNRKIETTDADEIRNLMKPYYSIDSEGELWVLGLKRIYKLNGSGFNEEFVVPLEINNLDVYNKSNLVAWGDDGNDEYVYVTNINEYEKDSNVDNDGTESEEKNFDESDYEVNIAKGWLETKQGWKYFDENGNQIKNSWIKVNEKWYLINENGIMETGWKNLSNKWYYLQPDGSMVVGWKNLNGKWYYLQSDGSMAIKWKNINGSWYYFNELGEMAIGWVNDSKNWYHLGTDGEMSIGWLKYNKKWYYLDGSGRMLTNTIINGYKIGSDGTLV